MVFGDEKEMDAVFHSDSLRNPPDWPGVIVEMPIPVPLGRFSLVGGFSGLLWAGGFGGPRLVLHAVLREPGRLGRRFLHRELRPEDSSRERVGVSAVVLREEDTGDPARLVVGRHGKGLAHFRGDVLLDRVEVGAWRSRIAGGGRPSRRASGRVRPSPRWRRARWRDSCRRRL